MPRRSGAPTGQLQGSLSKARRTRVARALAGALLALSWGCAAPPGRSPSLDDASASKDAAGFDFSSLRDATLLDSVPPDTTDEDAAMPDLATPDLATPDLAMPDLAMPDLGTPDLGTPDLLLPDFAHSDLAVLDLARPDLSMPDLVSCGTPGTLHLALVGGSHLLYTASYSAVDGWTPYAVASNASFEEVAIAAWGTPSRPLVVARLSDGTLDASPFDPCARRFGTALPAGSNSTAVRPSAVGDSGGIDVAYRGFIGGDQRLYHTRFDGSAWSAAAQQASLLTLYAPAAVRSAGSVHALFTGQNTSIYDGLISDQAGGGPASAVSNATSGHEPAAVVEATGAIDVVFTGNDTNLYWVSHPAGGAWTQAAPLCGGVQGCFITSNLAPQIALDATGAPIAAWVGQDGHVYSSTVTSGRWGTPLLASGSETTALQPAIAPGVGTSLAEIVYVRSDGAPRHTSLQRGWSTPVTINGTSIGATSAPALIVTP